MTVVPALGGQSFSYIFAKVYDSSVLPGSSRCLKGVACFQPVFDGSFLFTSMAVFVALYLALKRS